jgi:hypothetical protein
MHLHSIRQFRFLVPAALLLAAGVASGDPPAPPVWWSEGTSPVWDKNALPGNHGPATVGQAKWMAKRALEKIAVFDSTLATSIQHKLTVTQPGATGPILDFAVPADPKPSAWVKAQKSALLIGQLKAISAPFYDALHGADPVWLQGQRTVNLTQDATDAGNFLPWSSSTADDQNKSIATIGQLKSVFSLRFETLPSLLDWWNAQYLGGHGIDPHADADNDGLANYREYQLGTELDDDDSDGDGMKDGWEHTAKLNPLDAQDATGDADLDGLLNLEEYSYSADPNDKDTDDDYVLDGVEVHGL